MPVPKTSFSQSLLWYLPIVIAYLILGGFLIAVSVVIQVLAIPEISYVLSLSNPVSVVMAPFSGPLSDSTSSVGTMLVLLLALLLLLQLDNGFTVRWRYRTALCLLPLVSGVVASALYLIPMRLSGLAQDGSGSSIIAAGLNGMLVIMSAAVFDWSFTKRRYVDSAFSLVLLLTFVYAFRIGFLDAGNGSAHLYGFLVGLVSTIAYLRMSSRRSTRPTSSTSTQFGAVSGGGSGRWSGTARKGSGPSRCIRAILANSMSSSEPEQEGA